ncbi:MAG: hypothetical protein IT363_05795 [Methanoregulaceae archaeon]|nr:hypothetical protein [Methanoregulaceae archaeon]
MLASLLFLASAAPSFTKTVVDTRFVSEGVAVADVDRNGKLDIVAGSFWYRAPDWKPVEIAPFKPLEPKTQYADSFHNWMEDVDGDGWEDQIVIGMPGEKAIWRENPGKAPHPPAPSPRTNAPGRGGEMSWKEHLIWHSAGNESPHYVDLFKNGRRVLVMGTDDEYLAWFEPNKDPTKPWISHPISGLKGAGSQRYSHGLGVGDLDGDGKNEVLTPRGYYTQGDDPKQPWRFAAVDLGPDCAHMLVHDGGVLSTSAHARGVWSFAADEFKRTVIDETISQSHAAVLAPLGGNPNLITGKRKWAHPPGVDIGSEEASWLVRYEQRGLSWVRHVIDEDFRGRNPVRGARCGRRP